MPVVWADGVTDVNAANLNQMRTDLEGAAASKQPLSEKAQVNGYASLGADGKVPAAQLPVAATQPYALVREQYANGTAPPNSVVATWNTRVLNQEQADDGGIVALAANRITLAAGTYRVRGHAPAHQVARHKLRLRNVTDNVTLLVGSSAFLNNNTSVTHSFIDGQITVAAGKQLELQHFTELAQALGIAASSGEIEVYAVIEFTKVA